MGRKTYCRASTLTRTRRSTSSCHSPKTNSIAYVHRPHRSGVRTQPEDDLLTDLIAAND